MIVTLKVDIANKRAPEQTVSHKERHGNRMINKKTIIPQYFGRKNEKVNLISPDADDWRVVVIVENKSGQRFSVKTTDLQTL